MRRAVAGGAVAAGALAAAVLLSGGPSRAATSVPTAAVERRDLIDRDSVSGTLGYTDAATLGAATSGVLTRLPDEGAVITRGHSFYDLDNRPAAFLLYGKLPAWRDFTPWMADGDDIRQLERNLRALGYDPGTVDDEWDSDTTEAVKDFEGDRGLTRDGRLSRTEVVFRSGPTRIGERKAALGDLVAPGRPVAQLSSTRRIVTVALDATRQSVARAGDRVTVDMPGGDRARGRVSDVGTVATKADRDASPTIAVTVELLGKAARGTRLDQAPVDVGFEVERRREVLAVPVAALVARQGSGYAVETPDHRFVAVEPGLYADDYVEVSGDGLREGMQVVIAA